ncbi:MAG: hypothetical protein HQ500_08630 [Flavobacteriales bacterium]|nr:hypothetical protein [Flavobacteriales bacterium]
MFNRYRKGMPVSEMFLKDSAIAFRKLLDALQSKRRKTLLAFPHFPSRGSTLYQIARSLGWEITNRIDRSFELALYWEYATVREEFGPLERIENVRVVNLQSRDISKDVVDEQMQHAFGYSTRIDPSSFQGIAVKKSLQNAVHDGLAVECPCVAEEGVIYQRLIDSSVNEQEVMDLRIPVIGGSIPHIYLNYRKNTERFKNVPDRSAYCSDVASKLSDEEVAQIIGFCTIAGLEFCELDVLRDCTDHRIYIVDANDTPQGPPKHLPEKDRSTAIDSLSKAFQTAFIPT